MVFLLLDVGWWYLYLVCTFFFPSCWWSTFYSLIYSQEDFFSPFPPVSDFLSLYLLPCLISQLSKWLWLSFELHLHLLSHLSQQLWAPVLQQLLRCHKLSLNVTFSLKLIFPCLAEMLFFYLPPPFLFLVFSAFASSFCFSCLSFSSLSLSSLCL